MNSGPRGTRCERGEGLAQRFVVGPQLDHVRTRQQGAADLRAEAGLVDAAKVVGELFDHGRLPAILDFEQAFADQVIHEVFREMVQHETPHAHPEWRA